MVPRTIQFTRLAPSVGTKLPAIATRDTYFRTISALARNVSTSAWLTDASLTFPVWPSSDTAQLGPKLTSSYDAWNVESTTIRSEYNCQDMTLGSANLSNKRYSDVYTVQGYGPLNGTQPMVTFVLSAENGCHYELSIHPLADLAYTGGVTWSNASTFMAVHGASLPLGGNVIARNTTSTHVYSRLNTTEECKGRDILVMSTPWTVTPNTTRMGPFIPLNATYERSADFRMRGWICQSEYRLVDEAVSVLKSGDHQVTLGAKSGSMRSSHGPAESLLDIAQFQALSMRDDWKNYFDQESMATDAGRAQGDTADAASAIGLTPGFSGMAPLLGALSDFNMSSMFDDPDIVKRAARIKGRFFMETIREALDSPELMSRDNVSGSARLSEDRIVVLTEIGFTLASLFFLSSILFIIVFFTSRINRRPLNLQSDPGSTVGLALLLKPGIARTSTFRSMQSASRPEFYTALRREKYRTSNQALVRGNTGFGKLDLYLKFCRIS